MRYFTLAFIISAAIGLCPGIASAIGTARVQQSDGATRTYHNVHIRIANQRMLVTSSDGKGTLVIGKAACSMIGGLMRCYPSDVVLDQNGRQQPIPLQSGTVWFNPSSAPLTLPYASTSVPARGVLMSLRTGNSTYVSLDGTVDEVIK